MLGWNLLLMLFSLKRLNNSSEDQWTFHVRVTSKVEQPGWSIVIEKPGFYLGMFSNL